jgi:hypothetical protein
MAVSGVLVLAEVGAKLVGGLVPTAGAMGGVGLLAQTANGVCLATGRARRFRPQSA